MGEAVKTIALPKSGTLKVGVVADTHGNPHPKTREHLRAREPGLIVHAGDIGDLSVLRGLEEIAPLVAVRGNIDLHAPEIPEELCIDFRHGESLALRVFLTHIAVYGPKLRADVRRRAEKADARMVICGHSHVPLIARDGSLTIFNPGSIGPRRFQLPITFGMLTISPARVQLEHVDCETGEKWLPR
jgi:uncharacterized protein